MRDFFMVTGRIGFSKWRNTDFTLAKKLWGDKAVTEFISASGTFTDDEIAVRLKTEIQNDELYGVQYWCIFELSTETLVGCCGLRPYDIQNSVYEIGVHLCKDYWGKGYASEAMLKVIDYAFREMTVRKLFAGHNPQNIASQNMLSKLGFTYIGTKFYEPTGLYHPSYELQNPHL